LKLFNFINYTGQTEIHTGLASIYQYIIINYSSSIRPRPLPWIYKHPFKVEGINCS